MGKMLLSFSWHGKKCNLHLFTTSFSHKHKCCWFYSFNRNFLVRVVSCGAAQLKILKLQLLHAENKRMLFYLWLFCFFSKMSIRSHRSINKIDMLLDETWKKVFSKSFTGEVLPVVFLQFWEKLQELEVFLAT